MSLSNGFRRIANLLDEIEADDIEVRDAAMQAAEQSVRDGTVEITLDLAVTVDDGSTSEEASSVPAEATADPQADVDRDQQSTQTSGSAESDGMDTSGDSGDGDGSATESAGGVVCPEPGCEESFESEPGMKIHRTKVHRSTQAATTGDEPAYRDPAALRDAYEAHDSFPAMREALGVDVSAQTVRRHMIQHGIHDPEADEAGADVPADTGVDTGRDDSDAGDTPAASDGGTTDDQSAEAEPAIPEATPLTETLPSAVTAPAGVTFAELREAVRTANTLYDIQQQFDLDRAEARDLLDHLDLLELVHGRVATRREREELKAEIDSRIRHSIESSGTSA